MLAFLAMDLNLFIDVERQLQVQLIQWLQAPRLLANPLQCGHCNPAMDLNKRRDDHVDGSLR